MSTTKFVWLTQNSAFWSNGVGGRRAQRQEWLVPARSPLTISLLLVTRPAVLASSPLADTHTRWGLDAGLASRGLILEHIGQVQRPPGPCCARCVGWLQSANGMPGMPRSLRVIALAVFIALCICSRTMRRVWATACLCHSLCALTRPVLHELGNN
jgi:hypothetical protein